MKNKPPVVLYHLRLQTDKNGHTFGEKIRLLKFDLLFVYNMYFKIQKLVLYIIRLFCMTISNGKVTPNIGVVGGRAGGAPPHPLCFIRWVKYRRL